MKHIVSHFKTVDPILGAVAEKITIVTPTPSDDYFLELVETIINQQLSGKAADTITNRFYNLFPKRNATPEAIVAIEPEKLRGVGMSWNKVKFVQNLAQMVINKEINFAAFPEMDDEAVIVELVKVKGIGRWSAEMFLMFTLGRPDVFSTGDLGLKRAIQKLYKLKKEPTEKQLLKLSRKWSPYRTYASRVLWQSLDQGK